jgi:hypothetical protein
MGNPIRWFHGLIAVVGRRSTFCVAVGRSELWDGLRAEDECLGIWTPRNLHFFLTGLGIGLIESSWIIHFSSIFLHTWLLTYLENLTDTLSPMHLAAPVVQVCLARLLTAPGAVMFNVLLLWLILRLVVRAPWLGFFLKSRTGSQKVGDLSVGTKGSQASSRIQAVLIDTYHCWWRIIPSCWITIIVGKY